ncbi:hypothetical protein ACFY0G_43675 [Streptomyces sp. NPDC001552]|uniref:hypothetical protein n=1 Tax=Streptomyces sp. NPDC001552 TaxID=3364587 RepID=UPI0036C26379
MHKNRMLFAAAAAMAVLAGTAAPATASASGTGTGTGQQGTTCTDVKLPGTLPVPPPGMSAQQDVSIGADCAPVLGQVRFVPVALADRARSFAVAGADAPTGRQVRSWSEMYDCCKILMTALYTTSTWDTVNGQVTRPVTEVSHAANREPWNAGWSLTTSHKSEQDSGALVTAHAEFGYRGIFDIGGKWYANTHDTTVQLNGDGTASCTFDITLRHTFIGWNSVRGCS